MHRVVCSAGEIACKEHQDFHLGSDDGFMHFERLVNLYGRKQLIPVHIKDNIFNFHLNKEVKSTDTNIVNTILSSRETSMAEQRARKFNENSERRSGSKW